MIDGWTCEYGEKHWNGSSCDCQPPPDLMRAALEYAEAGWRVFPIKPGSKAPPLTRHGFKDAVSDPAAVRRLWEFTIDANIGIKTGEGLAVIDVDPRSGGALDPAWPETLTARTPSGGYHLYFGVVGRVRNSASVLAPGVDVRGDGGYVVGPPSVTEVGEYTWEHIRPIAPAPAGLFDPPGQRGDGIARYNPPDTVAAGARNDELVRYAGWLHGHGWDEDELTEALLDFNEGACVPPLDEAEVLHVARRCRTWPR